MVDSEGWIAHSYLPACEIEEIATAQRIRPIFGQGGTSKELRALLAQCDPEHQRIHVNRGDGDRA